MVRWCTLAHDIHACAFAVQINSPLSRLDFLFSEALVKTFNINAEKTKFYSSRLVYFTLADLFETKTVQEAEFRDCHWCILIHFASFYFDEK